MRRPLGKCPETLGQVTLVPLEQGPHGSHGDSSSHFLSSSDAPDPAPAGLVAGGEPPAEETGPHGVSLVLGSAGPVPIQ